jgi:hypothetical protein
MARQRPANPCEVTTATDVNDVGHVGSYDAFLGRYEVDTAAGTVMHLPERGLSHADVGRHLTRLRLEGDKLTLEFEPGGSKRRSARWLGDV